MSKDGFDGLSALQRESVRSALVASFGSARPGAITRITGGASGASTFKVEIGGRRYLLRIEETQVRCAIHTNMSRCVSQRRRGLRR
jgi:hypothetical protein